MKINNATLNKIVMDRDFDDVITFSNKKKVIKKFKMEDANEFQGSKKSFNRFDKRTVYVS